MDSFYLALFFLVCTCNIRGEPGVALFYPNADEITLTKTKQTIGPWHIDAEGSAAWNDYFSLKSGFSTMVRLRRSGVFSIFAQVLYSFDSSLLEPHSTDFLGYQIRARDSKRTLSLADCITPRLKDRSFFTCFTQVTRFLNEGEQVFLENLHFTPNNRSSIQCYNNTETFFGIIKF